MSNQRIRKLEPFEINGTRTYKSNPPGCRVYPEEMNDKIKELTEAGHLIACQVCEARPGHEWNRDLWVCELHKARPHDSESAG